MFGGGGGGGLGGVLFNHFGAATLVNSTLTGNTAGGGDGLVEQGLVEPERLLELFEEIEPELYRYPAIDPPSFRRAVEELVREKTP